MSNSEYKHFLAQILVGIHFPRPHFYIANHFNEILDSVSLLPNFNLGNYSQNQLDVSFGSIQTTLSELRLIIRTPVVITKELNDILPSKKGNNDDKYFELPKELIKLGPIESQRVRVGLNTSSELQETFMDECGAYIQLIDSILHDGIPAFRFIGLVEYYLMPMKQIEWTILNKFTEQASIENGENTEKFARNRYYFDKNDKGDKNSLIFKVVKPDTHANDDTIGGAFFDFQFIPKKPLTIREYGGSEKALDDLSSGLNNVINKSGFMEINFIS